MIFINEDTFYPSNNTLSIVKQAFEDMKVAQETKEEEISKVNTEIEMEEDESDEDIFADAGEYIPSGSNLSVDISSKKSVDSYFKV